MILFCRGVTIAEKAWYPPLLRNVKGLYPGVSLLRYTYRRRLQAQGPDPEFGHFGHARLEPGA